jgi:ABC-type branched-subunit amino acid transport system permease subunit
VDDFLALALAATSLHWRSRIGWGLISIREDETAAACLGVDITYYKVVAFDGAMVAGFAAPYAHLNYLITRMISVFHRRGPAGLQHRRTRIWYGRSWAQHC